jgi:hypothetical protein
VPLTSVYQPSSTIPSTNASAGFQVRTPARSSGASGVGPG